MTERAGLAGVTSREVPRDGATGARAPASDSALRVVAPAMVGRAEELERLLSVVSAPPAVAVIEGEAGIGKTRLLTELAGLPGLAGRRFVVGSCRRIGESFPLGPVLEALRAMGDDLAKASLSPVTGALRPLLPEIASSLPPLPEALHDRAGERHRVFRGLVEIFRSLGAAVLVVEDLHWADDQTSDFLAYLLGDAPPQMSVVVTFRSEEVAPEIRAMTARLPALRRAEIALAPLDADDTGSLAAAILETDRISAEFATHLWQRTSGVPFAIEEVLALLRERRDLVRDRGAWARRTLDDLDVPSGIRDSVLERVGRLSEDARGVIEAAAVLQAPVPQSVLMSVCTSPASKAGLEEALAVGLLLERGEMVGFRHVMAAQAVYEALSAARKSDLHGRAASALRQLDPSPLGQLAYHLRHAGLMREWAAVAEEAADRAIELGHEDEAARLLAELLRSSTFSDAGRQRVAVKLGRTASEAIHMSNDVIELLSEVLHDEVPRAVRGELSYWLAAAVETAGGDWSLRRRLFQDAARDLDHRPDLYARAMLGLGIPTVPGVALTEHVACLNDALEALSKIDDALLDVFVRGKVAMIFVAVGNPQWRQLAEQIVKQTSDSPRQRAEVNAYESIGEMAAYGGHYPTADLLLTAARQGAALSESPRFELLVQSDFVLLDFLRGSWDGLGNSAAVLADELTGINRINTQIVQGSLALAHGDLGDAGTQLTDVAEQAEAVYWFDALALALSALARGALATDEISDVAARIDRTLAGMDAKALWAPLARALPGIVQILIAVGRESDAGDLVTRAAKELSGLDAPLAPPALQFAEGFLAIATQDWTAATEHFITAARRYQSLECPYEEAQAREQAGLALLASGDARAEGMLKAALATYERLGGSWDVARCTRAARDHGVRLPVPHRGGRKGYGHLLSPREEEVARLAALGHTNKAIAAELFLSQNTVSKHLAGAMRKLEVHTRSALAGRLDDRE